MRGIPVAGSKIRFVQWRVLVQVFNPRSFYKESEFSRSMGFTIYTRTSGFTDQNSGPDTVEVRIHKSVRR